jgi:C-22 sterol desaturase
VPLMMAGMIGKASLELEWRHVATERSEEIRVFATLFPMVSTSTNSMTVIIRNILLIPI